MGGLKIGWEQTDRRGQSLAGRKKKYYQQGLRGGKQELERSWFCGARSCLRTLDLKMVWVCLLWLSPPTDPADSCTDTCTQLGTRNSK